MIQVQCNACGTTHQIDSSFAGTVVTCSACANPIKVPAMAMPVVKHPPAATPVGGPPPMAKPVVPSTPPPASSAAMASPLPPQLATSAASAAQSRGVGAALPDSQNIDRLASSVNSKMRNGRAAGFTGKLLLGLVCTTLVAAVLLGAYAAIEYLPSLSRSSKTAKRNGEDENLSTTTRKSPWTDVSQENLAQRLSGVKVQVLRVDFGEVFARDANNKVQSSAGSLFLQFFLRVENTTKLEIDYRSWYGNTFKHLDGQKSVAMLVDNEDRKYQMMTFGDVVTVKGHVPSATLKTRNVGDDRKYVEDVLIFDVPADVVPENVKYFRLELPAVAVDGKGHFRFQIPGSMVNRSSDVPPLEPPSSTDD